MLQKTPGEKSTNGTVCCEVVVCTLKLVSGVEDPHVCRYGVEPAAPDDVHAFLGCLVAVVQLHALQKLNIHSWKHQTCHTQVLSQ